ncbi:MAG: ATP-grasp domain-containing protein [Bacteroidetes bacterium]|jgi:hypothetical protein|nr:ATP-grasp domain-containing protein [Bacteroidota bacterium]
MKKNIFVLGLDDHNLSELKTIKNAEDYNFKGLLDLDRVKKTDIYKIEELIEYAEKELTEDPYSMVSLSFPFWLKPIKAHSSQLGFMVNSRQDFEAAIEKTRNGISRLGTPFNAFLKEVDVPEVVARVDGNWCIAEKIIEGDQFTISGYAFKGNIHTYGLIDSLNYQDSSSFFRYLYPSKFPDELRLRMAEISVNIISRIGLDNAPFNIEFFYDRQNDRLSLLEINPRISQSHADLYAKVDGESNHQVLVHTSLGRSPRMTKREGRYQCASKFHYRVFNDGVVSRAPSEEDLARILEMFPGTVVLPEAKEGMRLSEMKNQDAYSYRLAVIYMGAENDRELLANYRQCQEMLDYRIEESP